VNGETRIGVDLGGTKIEAVAVDIANANAGGDPPRELARERRATHRDLGYEHVLEETRRVIDEVARGAGLDPARTPIGVAMPGGTTLRRPDGSRSDVALIKNSNTTCLNGRPFRSDLERAAGRRLAFANDANCFALAEATWGAARGARVAFGVILGTGVGGGLVIRDETTGRARAWDGAQGIAGEWGHVRLEPERGPACYCGGRGCVETYLSGPAIEAEYARRTGSKVDLREIAAAAATGDPVAREVLRERVDLFGRALAIVIDIVDPDVIVLGGGVSNLDALQADGPAAVGRCIFNDELSTKIVRHTLGDSAGVLGAALLLP
jgi:fructokinase